MGGGTVGLKLAERGASVLFIEKGHSHLEPAEPLTGNFAEAFLPGGSAHGHNSASHPSTAPLDRTETLAAAGRYCDTISDISQKKRPKHFTPFIGSGTGGSSALYGMALERFFPEDFDAAGKVLDVPGATPNAWPIAYDDLAPYYAKAEHLFRVRGGVDPLRQPRTGASTAQYLDPPALSEANRSLTHFFTDKGLHPYQLPMACEYLPQCLTCQSYLCAKGCKNDASACVRTAIENHGALLLDQCEVTHIQASASTVTGITCSRANETFTVTATRYILAAGALETPSLLLRSSSAQWRDGLGNQNDQVGRNLMRHYVDLYAVFTSPKPDPAQRSKEIAFNDFYHSDGNKLGSVQSFGLLPPPRELANEIAADVQHSAGKVVGTLFNAVKPITRFFLQQIFSRTMILATTLEDLPFAQNRVTLSTHADANGKRRIQIRYAVHEQEKLRISKMRDLMKNALHPKRYLLLKQAENNERIAHVCGTARLGENPASSVCDQHQKVHGLDNLYIADSSVFPSSGGINPSLTIAALSLRLAQHLENDNHD